MAETKIRTEHPTMVLHTRPALEMDEEQFFELCQLRRERRIERSMEGDLEIMPPTGGETSNRNANLAMQVGIWTRRDGADVAFDSLTGIQAKMRDYVENGARLGWLVDPGERKINLYKPGKPVRFLDNPGTLSGEPVLPGFVLDLKPIWETGF